MPYFWTAPRIYIYIYLFIYVFIYLFLQMFLQHVYVMSDSGNTGCPFYLFCESGSFI